MYEQSQHLQPKDISEVESVLELLRRMGLIQQLGIESPFGYDISASSPLSLTPPTVNPYSAQPQLLERMLGNRQETHRQGIYSSLAGLYARPVNPLTAYSDTRSGIPVQNHPYHAPYQQAVQSGVGSSSDSLTPPRGSYSPILVSYSGYLTPRACGPQSYGGKGCGSSCYKSSASTKGGK
jgi:hypothetical protein